MTMRERIGNAIIAELARQYCISDDVAKEIREAAADAVLAELETPTQAMVMDGVKALPSRRLDADEVFAVVVAAIQSARKGA